MTAFYYTFHILGFAALLIYVLSASSRFGFPRIKAVLLCTASYISMYGFMLLLKLLITGTGGQNAIRAYLFLPFFVWLFAGALGLDTRKAMDFTAIAPCIVQGISHIGCLFPGCCRSWLRVAWGIYNPIVGVRLFPVQIAESITALLIAGWLLTGQRKKEYRTNGLDMPRMMIVFGGTRFFWEFLRDNEKLFCGISELALWALAMVIAGVIWILTERKKSVFCG